MSLHTMLNSDCDIVQTNIQTVSDKLAQLILQTKGLNKAISQFSTSYQDFVENYSTVGQMLAENEDIYNGELMSNKEMVIPLATQISAIGRRIQDAKIGMSLLASSMNNLRFNLNSVEPINPPSGGGEGGESGGTTQPGENPGETEQGGSQEVPNTASDKVYAFIINHEDTNIGMMHSANKFRQMLRGNSTHPRFVNDDNITWVNYAIEEQRLKSPDIRDRISDMISKVPPDGLFIFFFGGHGGYTNTKVQFMALRPSNKGWTNADRKITDAQFWDMISKCQGRVFAIFDCCHAGTMYTNQRSAEAGGVYEVDANDNPFGLFFGSIESQPVSRLYYSETTPTGNAHSAFRNAPVYIHLKESDGVKLLAISASTVSGWELGYSGVGGVLTTVFKDYYDEQGSSFNGKSYRSVIDSILPEHYEVVTSKKVTTNGTTVKGTGLCTFTDGFLPDDFDIFTPSQHTPQSGDPSPKLDAQG